jgi:(4S)-4-hydroxy-5-phosphonooxypentane-2,3-dione isomerase
MGRQQTTHGSLYVVTVEFVVHAAAFEEFSRMVQHNARQSVLLEPGCLRFDVLFPSGETPPKTVLLYEIYSSRAAFDVHLGSRHFLEFDAATRAMVTNKTVKDFAIAEHAKVAGAAA